MNLKGQPKETTSKMIATEYTQRLFGTTDDGVLYIAGSIMKAAKPMT